MSALLLLVTAQCWAEIYKWEDADGNIHFSDSKPDTQKEPEIVTPKVTPVPDEPDEGELRRLKLIEEAIAADAERELLPEDGEEEEQEEVEFTRLMDASRCKAARIQFGILRLEMPIYWTESGEMRAHWNDDFYQGERIYIADDERAGVRKDVERDIRNHCENPGDKVALRDAYTEWVDSEWCHIYRFKLADASELNTRPSDSDVEYFKKKISQHCYKEVVGDGWKQ